MIIRKYSWVILALFFLLTSCEKDTEPINFAPSVTAGSATNLYRFGATLSGNVNNPNGYSLKQYGIQYSLYQGFTEVVNVEASVGSDPKNFRVEVGGLEPGTGYYYRTYAHSGYSTIYSEARLFSTTSTNAPVFGQTVVDNVALTGFDVSAELLDDGGSELMMRGFVIKPAESESDDEFFYDTPGSTILTCGEDFQTTVKDLYTGTLYAIRPYGVANGVGYGKIAYVRTLTTDKTVLSSCVFSDTLVNSVLVQAHVLSVGTHPIVETGFCYSSESPQPTVNNLKVQASLFGNTLQTILDDLNSDTRYYVRAYAKSEDGEYTYGEVSEYTVVKHQQLEVTTQLADSITYTHATLWGHVRANNVEIVEKGFCWSKINVRPTLENANQVVVSGQSGEYSALMEVEAGTTYYFRAYAINTLGEVFYGEVFSFTSAVKPIYPPRLSDVQVEWVTDSIIAVKAEILDDGGSNIYEKGFCYVEGHGDPSQGNNWIEVSGDNYSFGEIISPLKANTEYTICAYCGVVNEEGEVIFHYSNPVTVTTAKLTPSEDDVVYPGTTR